MSEEQNINIKQRIIGALVLVSLGIIIIPMLLNGGTILEQSLSANNIPVMPKKLNTVLPKVPEPMVMPAAKAITAYPERTLTKNAQTDIKVSSPIALNKKVLKTNVLKAIPAAEKKQAELKKKIRPKSKTIADTTYQKASKPVSSEINTAYTLQIASFSKKDNANALQKKLRGKKHKAYIESIKTSKGRIYRLRVGPYLKYDQISSIKKQIEKQFKLKDTVILKYEME